MRLNNATWCQAEASAVAWQRAVQTHPDPLKIVAQFQSLKTFYVYKLNVSNLLWFKIN